MIGILLKGIFTGIILTLSFGAGFFALIETSINRGYKKALYIALGALLSDLVYIGLCLFASSFVENELKNFDSEIRIIGAVSLIIMGIYTYRKHKREAAKIYSNETKNIFYVLKGIVLNLINPLILLTWLGITAYQETVLESFDELLLYFSALIVAMFFNQFFLCYSATKIKKFLSDKFLTVLNHGIGIVFIVVAMVLLFPLVSKLIIG